MQIWNRHGKVLSNSQGKADLESVLNILPKGMMVEGEWVKKENALFLFDITYVPDNFLFTPDEEQNLNEFNHPIRDIKYHYLPAPDQTSYQNIMSLHPDDWMLQCKKDGNRVTAFHSKSHGIDIRLAPYEFRFGILRDWLCAVGNNSLKLIPYATFGFKEFYQECKDSGCEGVVAKRLNKPYQSQPNKNVVTRYWLKRRFKWDEI
jgi:hypothetical protein